MPRFIVEREHDETFAIYDTKGMGRARVNRIGEIDQEYVEEFERAFKLLEEDDAS